MNAIAEKFNADDAPVIPWGSAGSRIDLAASTAHSLFKGKPRPQQWLVERIFPLGKLAVLASPPGIGKSFLALDLARAVAGHPDSFWPAHAFGGKVSSFGSSVYVSAEDDNDELHRRLYSLTEGTGMPERLHVLSLPDVGHFGVVELDPLTRSMCATSEWLDLRQQIEALSDVRLIVLDTLQALGTGDTNNAHEVQPLMNECSQLAAATGATVLLIHHVGKGTSKEIKTALDAAESIRGSGAITGSARSAYVLWPPHDGGKDVCRVLDEPYSESVAVMGMVAKTNGDARRDMTYFLRSKKGLLVDVTQRYLDAKGHDQSMLHLELVQEVEKAWAEGNPLTKSQGSNGLHGRKEELPLQFHGKSKAWFEEAVMALLEEGRIASVKTKGKGGGLHLAPANTPEEAEAEGAP